jgi:hypothetical protein
MMSEHATVVAEKAKSLYDTKLRESLEKNHFGEYVCIEPISGDYFIGMTLDKAVNAAIDAHPHRLTHTLRVGHAAALHLGVAGQ